MKENFVIIGATQGAADSVLVTKRNAWSEFKDVSPLLTSRSQPLVAKVSLYSARVYSVRLYGSEI